MFHRNILNTRIPYADIAFQTHIKIRINHPYLIVYIRLTYDYPPVTAIYLPPKSLLHNLIPKWFYQMNSFPILLKNLLRSNNHFLFLSSVILISPKSLKINTTSLYYSQTHSFFNFSKINIFLYDFGTLFELLIKNTGYVYF